MSICPDCLADLELSHDDDGVWRLTVLHDHTCPWFAARTRSVS